MNQRQTQETGQQDAAFAALAAKRGRKDPSELNEQARQLYEDMDEAQLEAMIKDDTRGQREETGKDGDGGMDSGSSDEE
jgi:hypothetical protein